MEELKDEKLPTLDLEESQGNTLTPDRPAVPSTDRRKRPRISTTPPAPAPPPKLDDYVPIGFMHAATRRYPAWDIAVLAGAGHNIHVDQPNDWLDITTPWLRDLG